MYVCIFIAGYVILLLHQITKKEVNAAVMAAASEITYILYKKRLKKLSEFTVAYS